MGDIQIHDIVLIVLVVFIFYTSIRKMKRNMEQIKKNGGCSGSSSSCSVKNCPSGKKDDK